MTPGEKALREAARMESARVYGKACREHRQADAPATSPVAFRRPAESYYGPAPTADLAQLVEAIVPVRLPGPSRIPVEQSIARGLDDEQISALLDLDVAHVASIRARMEKASA